MGENVKIRGEIIGEGIGFQIGPQVFDGIGFRGIGRRILQVWRTRQDPLLEELALVSLEVVPDEHDGRMQLIGLFRRCSD
jgi:hypothetical protein